MNSFSRLPTPQRGHLIAEYAGKQVPTYIDALGNMGDSRAEPVLLKLLSEHPNNNIRYRAAETLAKVGTSAAIPVLERRLQVESSRSVQGRISWALRILRQKTR
ncbi:MAG: hypothetical protein KatS3mg023_0216 [Armatimonadota bacterium]|nr:MAG: hypothetical protein KatS3mg023_0216 [Armatimonadota bacterium]